MKPIYKPSGKAGEYCDLAVNIYTGCNHGCTYCYAPRMTRKKIEDFQKAEPRKGLLDAMKRQLDSGSINDRLIHLCFTCDPYPADIDTSITREVIKLIKFSGNHVQILTKGGKRAERDFDLLDKNDWFGVTVSGESSDMRVKEPNAAEFDERIDSLVWASFLGIKTWVSCEPVYSEHVVKHLITSNHHIDLYRIGKLNYAPSDIDWCKFGRECEALCIQYGRNYYIKEDLRKEMEKG